MTLREEYPLEFHDVGFQGNHVNLNGWFAMSK